MNRLFEKDVPHFPGLQGEPEQCFPADDSSK